MIEINKIEISKMTLTDFEEIQNILISEFDDFWNSDEADIMNVVTKKDIRNSGVGSALFSAIIDYAKSNKVKKITLEVNENNLSAIHLYEKFGFVKIAERKKYYNGTDTAIIMQLNLI